LRAEGFSVACGSFYGGLGITKLQFKKKKHPIFSNFGRQNPGFRLDPDPDPQLEKIQDPDPH
jgi:hypothetical protein